MTAAEIIRSLPRDPHEAKLQLDGALDQRWAHELAPEDRARLEAVRKSADKRRRAK